MTFSLASVSPPRPWDYPQIGGLTIPAGWCRGSATASGLGVVKSNRPVLMTVSTHCATFGVLNKFSLTSLKLSFLIYEEEE